VFIQADEAQRRRYNDGYGQYNTGMGQYDLPYEAPQSYGSVLPDPFITPPPPPPQQYPSPFADPPHDAYGQPLPPHSQSPPRLTTDYMQPRFNPDVSPVSQRTAVGGSTYDLHDDNRDDPGDIPLLRRDDSRGSAYSMPHMPGGYDEVIADNRSENNIRYGRIPQRVPRRYKTIKRVE
jgi:chitin synthase